MISDEQRFRESKLLQSPIRDLKLEINGTRLEPIVVAFQKELLAKGVTRLKAHCYLSTEWGVSFGGIAIGIPFYLARPDLLKLHSKQVGHIEGTSRASTLRYLRHEMGHVVNYAYKLYESEEWVKLFGSITQPYLEEYRPQPFSQRYVRHLPGWYAQKHPDEDWSETFAVWMTPRHNWRDEYRNAPEALAKLEYCDRIMTRLRHLEPPVTNVEFDDAVDDLTYSIETFYANHHPGSEFAIQGLDGALKAIFEDIDEVDEPPSQRRPAAELLRELEPQLVDEVFRWTGHFPEHTRSLLRHLEQRCDALEQLISAGREPQAATAVTTFVTSLAMNHVHTGSYIPTHTDR